MLVPSIADSMRSTDPVLAMRLSVAAWRASATADRFSYRPLPLVTSPYSNRPTGIQQVISFKK